MHTHKAQDPTRGPPHLPDQCTTDAHAHAPQTITSLPVAPIMIIQDNIHTAQTIPFAPQTLNLHPFQPAQSASATTDILLENATTQLYGPVNPASVAATIWAKSSTPKAQFYAWTDKSPMAAQVSHMITSTNVLAVETPLMEPKSVLTQRRLKAITPLKPQAWHMLLLKYDLLSKYLDIPNSIHLGFNASIVSIIQTYTPVNHVSILQLSHVFKEIVDYEFSCGHYIGPFSQTEVETLIGPFQTFPLALIDKPGKPNQYRLIQNLSYPHNPTCVIQSINHPLNPDLYPCTWSMFTAFCLLVHRLPPGTQGACRDVAEAYRMIPLAPS
jgi:hypothetical protein